MSDDETSPDPEMKLDGTRVVCLDHGIKGIKGCCGANDEPVKLVDETGFDLVEAIEDFEASNRKLGIAPDAAEVDEYNRAFFMRGPVLVIDEAADFDWDKVAEEITDSLSRKMAVCSTVKGPNWFKDYLENLDREFLYGPGGKPTGPEPIGLLRAPLAGPSRRGSDDDIRNGYMQGPIAAAPEPKIEFEENIYADPDVADPDPEC